MGLTALAVVVLVVLVVGLAVVMIGVAPDEDARDLVPVGSSLPDRSPPDSLIEDEDFPDGPTSTTYPEQRRIEGLPPLPDRDRTEVPGADPDDFCPSAAEFALATGWPPYEDSPPWIRHPNSVGVNDVLLSASTCDYPNQGGVSRLPDPDRIALDAVRRSRGEVAVHEEVVGGREYVVTVADRDGPGPRWISLLFAVGPDTYWVAVADGRVADGPEVACPIECVARLADIVVARVG